MGRSKKDIEYSMDFTLKDGQYDYSFQLRKKRRWWWLLLLLFVLCILLLILLGKNNTNDSSVPTPVPHTGDVQILLKWSNLNDLDLSCIDPNGDTIWYHNKRVPSGGELDVDMNAGEHSSRTPIENIYWPTGGAPKGQYTVYVTYYSRRKSWKRNTSYEIIVKHGSQTDTYTGKLTYVNQKVTICTFNIE